MKDVKKTVTDTLEEVKKPVKKAVKKVAPEKKEEPKVEVRKVRCSDCPLRAGLKDDYTLCPTCEGTGQVDSSSE